MAVVLEMESGTRAERYEALLRAANAIASCSDCDAAADALAKELREVISFDYLQIVAFENETDVAGWQLLYLNGTRKDAASTNAFPEGTPIGWVHEFQQLLVTPDWTE